MSGDGETAPEAPPEAGEDSTAREQRIWLPLYLYLGAVLIYGLREVGGNLERQMPASTAWLFVPAMLYLAVGALAKRTVPLRGEPIRRDERPRAYWTVVGLYFALAGALALFGSGLLTF
ncbi:MAG: hypothetical protein AAF725_13470 [Acidobacteriota bacterium]